MAPHLSPFARASAVSSPRQLASTAGLARGGFEFLKGSFSGIKGYVVGRMTKSRRGKIYIDDVGWALEADSIEYGYRVPFDRIHVFISKIGESEPESDTCTDIIEMAQSARPAKVQTTMKHAFVGFTHGVNLEEGSVSSGDTTIYSGDESSTSKTNSIYQLQDGGFGGCSDGDSIPDPYEPPNRVAIFMGSTLRVLGSTTTATMTSM